MFKILAIVLLCFINVCWVLGAFNLYWTEVEGEQDIGSKKCQGGEFPFMVFFTDKKCMPTYCSGSLISTEWVLTSKECVEQKIDINNCLAIAGTNYLPNTFWDERTMTFVCLLAATHAEGNLGLVKIYSDVPFPTHLYLIPFYSEPYFPRSSDLGESGVGENSTATVVGFQDNYAVNVERGKRNVTYGESSIKRRTVSTVTSLRKVILPLMSADECARNVSELLFRDQAMAMVCTTCDFGGTATCLLDTGGPLIYNGHVLGVVSGPQSKHCFFKNSLAVYTKVSPYADWIESTLQLEAKSDNANNFDRDGLEMERSYRTRSGAVLILISPLLLKLILYKVTNCVLYHEGLI